MFKNYLTTSFRNILRHKGFSFINIIGLAIGMAACLLMLMYVVHETSFDNFQENKERIYRIGVEWGPTGNVMKFAGSMPAIALALGESSPEVESAARLREDNDAVIILDSQEKIDETNSFFADPEIFDILTFNLIEGDKKNILQEPYQVVLSEQAARKYFGDKNPLYRTLNYDGNIVTVVGVFKDLPENSHLACRFLISYSTLEALGQASQQPWNEWGQDINYLLLKEHADIAKVQKQIDALFLENAGEWMAKQMKFNLDPLSRIHWILDYRGDLGAKGNISYVYIFLSASILILLIACFNFVNLSISQYFENLKSIGIRKVAGATRGQIVVQFLTESFLTTLIAVLLGCVFFEILNNIFYSFLGTSVTFHSSTLIYLILIIIGLVFFVGILAGSYPALYISRFEPVRIIKGNRSSTRNKTGVRKALTVLQFTISIILIIASLIIYRQVNFMKHTDLGYDKNNVLIANFPINSDQGQQKYRVLEEELSKNPGVISVSGAFTLPGIDSHSSKSIELADEPEEDSQIMQFLPGDYGFVKSMGLTLLEGRDFSREFSTDASESIILNESAVKTLGLGNPVGTLTSEGTIIGVVKDFHVSSLRDEIRPLVIQIDPSAFIVVMIKIRTEDTQGTIASIKKTWSGILPEESFNYTFMENAYNKYYRTEDKTNILLFIFTVLAILVSCLGLLGLVSFTTAKRTKEIGIRKMIGATSGSVIILLIKDFVKWVVIANVVAWPIAWFIADKWLQNYAYRMNVSLIIFIVVGGVVVFIAIATVFFHTYRAANANPVDSIKYE